MALVSVSNYSKITGKDTGTIRKLLANGRIKGVKIGNQWAIDENEPFPIDKRITTGEYKNWRKYSKFENDPLLKNTVKSLIKKCKNTFGKELLSITLYGSYARGEQTEESDVDIALKFIGYYDKNTFYNFLDNVSEMELECGKILSVIDIDAEMFDEWGDILPFYKNIKREGIVLWQA